VVRLAGVPRVASPQEYEAWVDQIVVDIKRIGCVD